MQLSDSNKTFQVIQQRRMPYFGLLVITEL